MASEKSDVVLEHHEAQGTHPVHAPHAEVELHHDRVAPEAIGGLYEEMPKGYFWSKDFMGTLIATCLAQISGYLGWVLPANTLTLINEALGGSPNITWVALSWTLGFTIGLALVGRLSDIFGRRWFFIGSSLMALVGNIIGASAQSVNQLIGTNCLNGLAAAGQLSFSVIIGELVPNRQRGPFNALVLSTSVPFAVFGPPVARAFYENTGLQWRWSYILGCIINLIAAGMYFLCYHPPTYTQLHVGGKSKMSQLKGLDWIGIFLFTAGLVLFLIGLNWGGQAYPWASAQVLCTLIFGIATIVGFCFWEAFSGHEFPLIPMRLFKNGKYNAITACASIAAMVYYSMTVVWPTLIGALFTTNVKEIGWLSCAVGGGLLFGQIAAGFGIRYIPRMKIQMTVAAVIMVAFVASLADVSEYSRTRTVVSLLIGTAAAGYIENLTLSSMALVWEPEDIGLVAGVMGSIRTASSSIATSIYISILSNELTKYLPRFVVPAATEAGLPATSMTQLFAGITAGSFAAVPGMTPEIGVAVGHAVKHAYSLAFRTVFLCTLPFGAIILVAAVISPNVEDYLTDDVARKLQGKAIAGQGSEKISDAETSL
ncbi:fungal trichothecene efflux pump [Amylocarpus encephaloides]|uniref:Fungal trichothecene efflux pump n=1 Tax=Amylocarpus encephaloides TaxID=45428 RepID=A0A9P7YIN7_9HELO|nr:fungal trichothecene efflux pump [Amylocarpus encephaloides]